MRRIRFSLKNGHIRIPPVNCIICEKISDIPEDINRKNPGAEEEKSLEEKTNPAYTGSSFSEEVYPHGAARNRRFFLHGG